MLIKGPHGVFTADGAVADYWLSKNGHTPYEGSEDPRVYITKDGAVQNINPDTYPYWAVQGWSIDQNADGVPDVLAGIGGEAEFPDVDYAAEVTAILNGA